MSVCILVDTKRQVAYGGLRALRSVTTNKVIDTVVDWSDLRNPDISAVMMEPERARTTQETLRLMGYETEVVTMSQNAQPSWLFWGAIAMLIGYIVATMVF